MLDHFRDQCGVFGVLGDPEAASITYLGLYALQHRGQESSGIVASDGSVLRLEVGMGLVADVFTAERLGRLPGRLAIGHNRYSTAGSSNLANAQPLVVTYSRGGLAVAHNGNLVNARELRRELEKEGAIFRSTTDTEVIVHLIARSQRERLEDRVTEALSRVEGAYALVLMTEDKLIGVRDPRGFRPLLLGRRGGACVLASESCAFDLIEGEVIREVESGEMVVASASGLASFHPFPPAEPKPCVFELVYFARPDSRVFGQNVYQARKAMGERLAEEHPAEADLVIPVPDSGVPAAMGYARRSGIPFEFGLIRNHYVGRTFIEPRQSIRHFGVKVKLNPVNKLLEGSRLVVVDDSIVRATTMRKIVYMLRQAGAREVHVRISSPPIKDSCFYGIDTPRREELIASSHSVEETRRFLGADTLGYLSLEGMLEAAGDRRSAGRPASRGEEAGYCTACFTGCYPVPVPERMRSSAIREPDSPSEIISIG
ncbi:MAG: amidophosphoribosyltransferase [Candidatus Tectomicrobia bacterium]|nr:amidophosphoribosyltransferase [Candidatus Tectomicrobia bacterium]